VIAMNRLRDLRNDEGFAMIVVMVLMLVGGAFVAAALASADGDQPGARRSQDRKAAYAAAEAGVEYYKYLLSQNNDAWTLCTGAGPGIATEWNPATTPADPRKNVWRTVPGASTQYAIELLPASGTACQTGANAQASMIDSSGVFRIRSTGRANGVKRSIVATFRRPSFLDYIYFTDFETLDPTIWGGSTGCSAYRPARASLNCQDIQFAGGDKINGPLHTNDSVLIGSGGVTFGSAASDPIEISTTPALNGSTSLINWVSTNKRFGADKLPVPTSNGELATVAGQGDGILLTGLNTVRLDASTDTIHVWKGLRPDQTIGKTPTDYAWPTTNQVLYDNPGTGGCTSFDSPQNAVYTDDGVGCAELFISGTYDQNLTVGSARDIVVAPSAWKLNDASKSNTADLTNTGDALLGLIATNFVRVWHPVNSTASPCTNQAPAQTNLTIDAAILGLHSFIVDNWKCAKLGTLSVDGAIAQKFRGTVGTGSGTTGYIKNYTYDPRLKYRSPPFFLAPALVAWKVVNEHEQVPAT
jgi:Tfp pilus assembly protein PilX